MKKRLDRYPEAPLDHERVPQPDIYMDGAPVYILDKGALREKDKPVQLTNIDVAGYMADFVKTTLGPFGSDKLIIAQEGKSRILYLSNDAKMIFQKIPLQHPIAQFLAGAAVATSKEVGSGTVTSILLAGEILRKFSFLLEKGIHPTIIQDTCMKTMRKVLQLIEEHTIPMPDNEGIIKHIVKTSLTSGSVSVFYDLILDMILKILKTVNREDLESILADIEIKRVVGGWVGDSRLVMGCTFYREPTHPDMPQKVTDAKIAILKGGLKIPERGRTRHLDHNNTIETIHDIHAFREQRVQILKGIIDKVLSTGANTLFIEKGIDPLIMDYLVKSQILVIRRFPYPELERVARATGANIVSDIDLLEESDLGKAKNLSLEWIAGEPWWFIEDCESSEIIEILLRGTNTQLLGEVERAIKSMFKTLAVFYRDKRLVAGGGALEMEIAHSLRKWARNDSGKGQVIIDTIADAFEQIPSALIETTGLHPLDYIPTLRSKHADGFARTGFNVMKKKIENTFEHNIVDPAQVKIQVIKTAFEAVYTILRIDDFILCRQLPKPEADYARRMRGTSLQKMDEIKKDYGVDS
ncbi:thermosome subunit beta [[Eubacterium] cellulosolvens]